MRHLAWLFVVLCGCGPVPPSASAPDLAATPPSADGVEGDSHPGLESALAEAVAGVDDAALAALLRDHWAWVLEHQPLRATRLGVKAYNAELRDESLEAIASARRTRDALLARARAIDPSVLSERDRSSRALFIEELSSAQASDACRFELWSVSPRHNHITRWNNLPQLHRVTSPDDGADLLARYRGIDNTIDAEIERLRRGASDGLYATAESIRRIITMVDRQLAQPVDEWPMLEPAAAEHPDWPPKQLSQYREALRATVKTQVKPALTRWAAALRALLPNARGDAASGLAALPNGERCYAARIEHFTTLKLDARTIHDIGLRQIARIDAEFVALGQKALGTRTLAETLAKLRNDKSLYFTTEAEVERAAQEALDDAKAKMGQFFGILPKADCVIRRVPDYEAPFTTIAYYRPPHTDGTKPGEYFVNVMSPTTRPRYQARVLALHEAIPGHHLQIAISQQLPSVPAFRKHGGFTAFVEGWALYTERLGHEMGLYRDDLDLLGVLSFDAWRAGRLVVDTGIHALGWGRVRAKAFLQQHTALALNNIDNEVDRYVSWPGQALAYKLGQLEIRKLRAEAEAALGDQFVLAAFHDVVLSSGAVSLSVLRERVATYIAHIQLQR